MALPKTVDGFPRRNRVDHRAPAERVISDAITAVERLGADPRLTDAVILLAEARDKVSDCLEDPSFVTSR